MLGRLMQFFLDSEDLDPDLNDRTMMYYRMLTTNPEKCQTIVTPVRDAVEAFTEEQEDEVKQRIFQQFNTLSTVFGLPQEAFTDDEYLTVQRDDLDGEDDDAYLIQTISLSYDGKIVAFGSSRNVYVYQFNISIMEWNLVGDKNSGIGNYSGKALSLSNNGELVAIGICSTTTPTPGFKTTLIPDLNSAQTLNTAGTPITLCNCSVFKFDQNKWNNIGNNITLRSNIRLEINKTYDSTQILSLSHNGQKLAVVNSGETDSHLRMYTFNSTSKNLLSFVFSNF